MPNTDKTVTDLGKAPGVPCNLCGGKKGWAYGNKQFARLQAQRDELLEALKDATEWFIEGERKAGLPDPKWVISGLDAINKT